MTLCYMIEEAALGIESFITEIANRLTSTTPIDIVFRSSIKAFVLYLSCTPTKDDEVAIADLAHKAGFSDVTICAGTAAITLRISPTGTYLYDTSNQTSVLDAEQSAMGSNAFNIVCNNQIRTKGMLAVSAAARLREVTHIAVNKETTRLRNEKIEERLMDL